MDYTSYIPPSDYYIIDDESEEQMEDVAYQYGDIEKIIDFDSATEIPKVDSTMKIDSLMENLKIVSIDNGSKKYKKYTSEQVCMFVKIMQDEGTTVPRAAVRCGIPRQSAYRLLKEFNDSNGSVLPDFAPKAKNRGTKQKLSPQHTHFLIQYLDNHRSSTMGLTKDALLKQFPDIENISIPSLWKHVTIEPANVTVHKQRGANIGIVGCIAYFGTVNFSKVEPLKRGTTAYHIVNFMETVMDTLDKHDKKGLIIVMENCRIHHSAFVVDAINKREYKPLFMPPYSPFLNPIEECWSKIKSNIKRNPLDEADTLTSRPLAACGSVTVKDCQGWVKHVETF